MSFIHIHPFRLDRMYHSYVYHPGFLTAGSDTYHRSLGTVQCLVGFGDVAVTWLW